MLQHLSVQNAQKSVFDVCYEWLQVQGIHKKLGEILAIHSTNERISEAVLY